MLIRRMYSFITSRLITTRTIALIICRLRSEKPPFWPRPRPPLRRMPWPCRPCRTDTRRSADTNRATTSRTLSTNTCNKSTKKRATIVSNENTSQRVLFSLLFCLFSNLWNSWLIWSEDFGKNLRAAAKEGDLRAVDHVLGTSTNGDNIKMINSPDENGWQALHEAARNGNLEVFP